MISPVGAIDRGHEVKIKIISLLIVSVTVALLAAFCLVVTLNFFGISIRGPLLVDDGKGIIYFFIIILVMIRLFYVAVSLYREIRRSRNG